MNIRGLRVLACLGFLILGSIIIPGCAKGPAETSPTNHFAATVEPFSMITCVIE